MNSGLSLKDLTLPRQPLKALPLKNKISQRPIFGVCFLEKNDWQIRRIVLLYLFLFWQLISMSARRLLCIYYNCHLKSIFTGSWL